MSVPPDQVVDITTNIYISECSPFPILFEYSRQLLMCRSPNTGTIFGIASDPTLIANFQTSKREECMKKSLQYNSLPQPIDEVRVSFRQGQNFVILVHSLEVFRSYKKNRLVPLDRIPLDGIIRTNKLYVQ